MLAVCIALPPAQPKHGAVEQAAAHGSHGPFQRCKIRRGAIGSCCNSPIVLVLSEVVLVLVLSEAVLVLVLSEAVLVIDIS